MKLRPGYPAYVYSRALANLRLGKLDTALADYDAAAKANPRNAWSLYTREIAERRAGKTEAADADREAALAINPNVTKRAARYRLDGRTQPGRAVSAPAPPVVTPSSATSPRGPQPGRSAP